MIFNENNNRLIGILLDNIDYAEYNLNEDEKKWIYMFMNVSPETFINLDTDLQTITEHNNIQIFDIPTVIKIIADTYFLAASKLKTYNESHMFVFITYTMTVILDSEILILDSNVKKEALFNIIDSSIALLNMNLTFIGDDKYDHDNDNNVRICCLSLFDSIINIVKKCKLCCKTT